MGTTMHPPDRRYTTEHQWVKPEDKNICVIGITAFAQAKLQDITHVDLPAIGDRIRTDEPYGTIESMKSSSELYAPVSGEVTRINQAAVDNPQLINEDPYGEGWLLKVKPDHVFTMDT